MGVIAEAGPEYLPGEHLPETLKLKTGGKKSIGTGGVPVRHS